MMCKHCGKQLQRRAHSCGQCGAKLKQHNGFIIVGSVLVSTALLCLIGFGIMFMTDLSISHTGHAITNASPTENEQNESVDEDKSANNTPKNMEIDDIVSSAEQTVYTIYTEANQGSGFLYNLQGDIVTNAHVVEGALTCFIKTVDGTEHTGHVIGYSSETDVAIIRVPDLAGTQPFPINKTKHFSVGENVLALGSPNDHKSESTGAIVDEFINFSIDNYDYDNLYKMTADIAEGSSGGPLISGKTGEVFAINSAESIDDPSIGYSIPLYEVASLLDKWSKDPLEDDDILQRYYETNASLEETDNWTEDIPSKHNIDDDEEWNFDEDEALSDNKPHKDHQYNDDNWYYDIETDQLYYYDESEKVWYYFDETNDVLMEIQGDPTR
ncbi:trypsin-like peptidase domain-containing protein [Lentibacillus saliphilus]|uniref:trypsin-like peptidase domain-containing protein n=1 Tax=Lentibacillus saliphilus TaxID=2737028 RepID=UPI001C304BC0|nr:trypsin-like peptidase domain-containing protein [Lentibacillus saliphilus]